GVLDRVEGGLAARAPFDLQLPLGGGCPHCLNDGADLVAKLCAQRGRLADRLAQRGRLLQSPGQRVVRLDPCAFGKRIVEIVAGRNVGGELCRQHRRDKSGGLLAFEDERADPRYGAVVGVRRGRCRKTLRQELCNLGRNSARLSIRLGLELRQRGLDRLEGRVERERVSN